MGDGSMWTWVWVPVRRQAGGCLCCHAPGSKSLHTPSSDVVGCQETALGCGGEGMSGSVGDYKSSVSRWEEVGSSRPAGGYLSMAGVQWMGGAATCRSVLKGGRKRMGVGMYVMLCVQVVEGPPCCIVLPVL